MTRVKVINSKEEATELSQLIFWIFIGIAS